MEGQRVEIEGLISSKLYSNDCVITESEICPKTQLNLRKEAIPIGEL